jgi:hypothetical protein
VLEHHAHLAADSIEILDAVVKRNSVNGNAATLVFFQPIDAADQRRLSGAGRAAHDDPFAACYV